MACPGYGRPLWFKRDCRSAEVLSHSGTSLSDDESKYERSETAGSPRSPNSGTLDSQSDTSR